MKRFLSTRRFIGHRDAADKPEKPTFDIPHVWPDLHEFAGVVFASWICVQNMSGGPIVVRMWGAGWDNGVTRHELGHGALLSKPVPGFGPQSMVIENSHNWDEKVIKDIHFWWELTPGKK